jgi:hypothetical protein
MLREPMLLPKKVRGIKKKKTIRNAVPVLEPNGITAIVRFVGKRLLRGGEVDMNISRLCTVSMKRPKS